MAIDPTQLTNLLAELSTHTARVLDYRRAAHGHIITLPDDMAAILGTPQRRAIPVLGVVVEAIASKLYVKDWNIAPATPKKVVTTWLNQAGWATLERRLWESVVRDGRGYVLVTWDPLANRPRLTRRALYDGQDGAMVVSDPDTGQPAYGVNVYRRDKDLFCDVFYPEAIYKFRKDDKSGWAARLDEGDAAWPVPWSPGVIPLVEFGDGVSDIDGALQLARDLNDALVDLQAVSRSQGWPQRWLRGDHNSGFVTNINGQPIRRQDGTPIRRQIKLAPGSVLVLQGSEAELAQLASASLDPTLVDTYLRLLTWVTTVPSHYFTGEWPSGVALLQAEARLNEKAESHQAGLTGQLATLVQTILAMARAFGPSVAEVQAVDITWEPVQVITEDLLRERENQTAQLYERGLITLAEAVKRIHPDWTDDQVQKEVEALKAEKAERASLAPQVQALGPGGAQPIAQRAAERAQRARNGG